MTRYTARRTAPSISGGRRISMPRVRYRASRTGAADSAMKGPPEEQSSDDAMRWLRLSLILLLAIPLLARPGTAQPRRIVSINACTDQLLFKLAPERIAALSTYAADPTL